MKLTFRTGSFNILFRLCVASILLALILDSSPHEGRRKAIEAALKSGQMGHLTPDRYAYLMKTLSAIADEAELHESVVLNSTDKPHALHVYTTSPSLQSLTGCGKGNAIYDAAQDAIFIDEGLVNPTDFINLGEETPRSNAITVDDIPPLKTYLLFLLFHELGHRTLHRHTGKLFDFGKARDRRREVEADQFAISLLEKSLAKQSALTESIFAQGYSYGLPITAERSPRDRVWLALVDMAHFISISTMFSATPLSAVFQDAAHPSFIDRAESIMADAQLDNASSPKLQEYFRLSSAAIARVRAITTYRVVELIFSERIYSVSFDPEGVLVVPENPKHLYHLRASDLADAGRGMVRTVKVPQESAVAGSGFGDLGPGNTRQYGWSAIWSTPSAGAFSIRPGQSFVSNGGFWKPVSSQIQTELSNYSMQNVSTAPEPSTIAIVQASTSTAEPILISLCDGNVCAKREIRSIADEAKLDAKYFFLNTVAEHAVYLEAHIATSSDALGSLRGVIKLDSRTLRIKHVFPLTSEVCSVTTEFDAVWDPLSFVVVPEEDIEHFLCIASRHDMVDQWYAWELNSTGAESNEVVSAPFVLAALHKRKSELDDFEVRNYSPSGLSAKWAGGNKVVLQLFQDSSWLIDLGRRRARILFHPGGEATRVAIGHGLLAIYYRSGYKCYLVISPEVNDN